MESVVVSAMFIRSIDQVWLRIFWLSLGALTFLWLYDAPCLTTSLDVLTCDLLALALECDQVRRGES